MLKLLFVGILGLSWQIIPKAPVETSKQGRIGVWTYVLKTDSFTGGFDCKLTQPGMSYSGGVLVLYFPRNIDTSNAWYKFDAGPARPWRGLIPKLIDAGAAIESSNLENPSDGRMPFPVDELTGVKFVWVQTAANAEPRLFKMRDFTTALAFIRRYGCR